MKWFRSRISEGDDESRAIMREIKARFEAFLSVLDYNNQVHQTMSELEEKSQGERAVDFGYLRTRLQDLRGAVAGMIDSMVTLGGERYEPLRDRFVEIDSALDLILPQRPPLTAEAYTIPFTSLGRHPNSSVGSKCTQLGQIMVRLGLPVPDGFAITGWAYQQFLEANQLFERINQRLDAVEIDKTEFADLVAVSDEIRIMIEQAEMPPAIAQSIQNACEQLVTRTSNQRMSVRSSALGEDTYFSYAGQYATFLNVVSEDVIARYRDIIASKFSPQAMYYYLSLSQPQAELAMSVGCVEMVDARSSGVLYTRDPIRPHDEVMVVNSIFGLGEYLVDGTLTPDSFRVSRQSGRILRREIVAKPVQLVLNPDGGTVREVVAENRRAEPSLSDAELQTLADYARRIEFLYHCPQDIEWAIDRQGRIFILQSRNLRIIEVNTVRGPDLKDLIPLMRGGVTVCPGAGGGPVYHASSVSDLPGLPPGAVLVAPHSFPGIVTVMRKVSAIVTEVGGVANHMATIAREYGIPTLGGVRRAADLPAGKEVTVDATKAMIYDGVQQQLVTVRRCESEPNADAAVVCTLRGLLGKISPLNLIHPRDENFSIERCDTYHDLTRFCHQRAMEEMFYGGLNVPQKERLSVRLKTEIPLEVNVIYVDQELTGGSRRDEIDENQLESTPMRHFWDGIRAEGWPAPLRTGPGPLGPLSTILKQTKADDYSQSSFALLGREYMILNLRMGYHFTTVEALCSDDEQKNYVRMEYKEGGATPERRARRITLIKTVLSKLGFEHHGKGDFLDTRLTYRGADSMCRVLFQLGRLTMMTKQLDMALSNERIAAWYTRQIMKALGIQ